MKSLRRSVLGGESLFVSTYTAPAERRLGRRRAAAARATSSPSRSTGRTSSPAARSWPAPRSLELDTKWGGFGNLFGGEGGFLVHMTGTGTLVGSCYGALDRQVLAPGETITVDSGHLVSYDEGIQISARKAAKGLVRTAKTGEDLVFDVTGPGEVTTQSRNPDEFVEWIIPLLPFSRS